MPIRIEDKYPKWAYTLAYETSYLKTVVMLFSKCVLVAGF